MEEEASQKELTNSTIYNLLKERDFNTLVHKAMLNKLVTNYSKFKYEGHIYKVGGSIQMSALGKRSKKLYGQILEIVSVQLDVHKLPVFKVQLYVDKGSLNTKQKDIMDGVSEFELFLTEQEGWFFVDCIDYELTMMTLKEYEESSLKDEKTYFSRAEYNVEKDKFNPPVNKWGRICFCNQVTNPDKAYIQCDKCLKWLHCDCVNLSKEDGVKLAKFYCSKCQKHK